MKLMQWSPERTDKESKDCAYWERNMLALNFAEGWYNDDIVILPDGTSVDRYAPPDCHRSDCMVKPRFDGWRRVLSLQGGSITFHIPDDFDVGNLPEIQRNWDGHTTAEKWKRIASRFDITLEE